MRTTIIYVCKKCNGVVNDSDNYCLHCGIMFDETGLLLDSIDKEVNVQKEYNKYNKLYFGGKLPKIPIKWKSIDNGGKVITKVDKDGKMNPERMELSKKWDINKEQFIDILLHEMIHVWESVNQLLVRKIQHGSYFKQKMKEINAKGHNITLEHDVTSLKISEDEKMKSPILAGLIYKESEKKWSIMVMAANMEKSGEYKKLADNFKRFADYYKSNYTITVVKSYNPQLKKYPKVRKFKRIVAYDVDKDLVEDLLKEEILSKDVVKYKKKSETIKTV